MLITVLDLVLVPLLPQVFPTSGYLINSLCYGIMSERSKEGRWHSLSKTSSDSISWNKLTGCWQLKVKKNQTSTINNYGATITHTHTHTHIYIYIYIYIHVCVCVYIYIYKWYCFLLYVRDRQMRYLVGAVSLCHSLFQRVGVFTGEAWVLKEVSYYAWSSGMIWLFL